MTETTVLRPDIDWGPNADGWEFIVENRTKYDLQIDYSPSSNVGRADPNVIRAGRFGRVKGIKGLFDPADMDFSCSRTSGPGWVIVRIRSTFGDVTRVVRNDTDRVIEAYFPDQPRNEAQRVILQSVDFWGPNVDGWGFTIENDTTVDLYLQTTPFSNIDNGDRHIGPGREGRVKGMHGPSGGPRNCDFGYYARSDENGVLLTMTRDDVGNPRLISACRGNIRAQVSARTRNVGQAVRFVQ
jgi:hypothetical protein